MQILKTIGFSLIITFLILNDAGAADPFVEKVVPFLKSYCVQCHNEKRSEGELNLVQFSSSAMVAEHFRQWEHIITFLKKEEMPPAKSKQPSPELRSEILSTITNVIKSESQKLSGDPGIVPPRRLTNAEFNNSIRDLTGVDIRPADSFPIDPASGEGFSNTGEALIMSPNLFRKYYSAAEQVANHAVLSTEGLRFAPHPVITFADRQKFYEQAIISFYESHSVDLENYLTTLWLYKHRPETHKAITLSDWAKKAKLSSKYAMILWNTLEGKSDNTYLIGWLQGKWNNLPSSKNQTTPITNEVKNAVKSLVAEIQNLSRMLTPVETPAIVANAGNGPIEHLQRRRLTASNRDAFDKSSLSNQKSTVEYHNVTMQNSIKLIIQLGDVGTTKAAGNVLIKAYFSSNNSTIDNKKKWSLRDLLAQHAPDTFIKLKFGTNSKGEKIDQDSFMLNAPSVLEIDLPTNAFPLKEKGNVILNVEYKFDTSMLGIVSVFIGDKKQPDDSKFIVRPLISAQHAVAPSYESSAEVFCKLFPNRFFYVDSTRGLSAGFHLIEGFFRDDQPLCRSVLEDPELLELNNLWKELYFVTGVWEKMLRGFVFFERSERNFLKHMDFDSFREEDPDLIKDEVLLRFKEVYLKRANVKLTGAELNQHPISIFFDEVRNGIRFKETANKQAEIIYFKNLLTFTEKANRRNLTDTEKAKLEAFFTSICNDKTQGTDAAVRASIIRTLVSPSFGMLLNTTAVGETVTPLSDIEMASRISYFIWAGPPDSELLALAQSGTLRSNDQLQVQVKRMLADPKVSRFSQEFLGQWLGYRDFLTQESVNRTVFPQFDDKLKQAMFEEPTNLFTYLIQKDKPIINLLNSDETFVNKKLAQHYGLPHQGNAEDWELVTGLNDKGRSGILSMAVFLTKNSQPQRTSPVKRGFWVVHKVLGEHIPPPPADVAVLPAKEAESGQTIRQLLKLHVDDNKCARCHQRFDSIGLALEGFDPIGKARTKDLAGRNIDNVVLLPDGKEVRGVPLFADHLAKQRAREFTQTLGNKFLGYALGRSLQLSDQPLLDQMQAKLETSDFKMSSLFELVVNSPQFRTQRCKDFSPAKFVHSINPRGDR